MELLNWVQLHYVGLWVNVEKDSLIAQILSPQSSHVIEFYAVLINPSDGVVWGFWGDYSGLVQA